MHTQTVAPSVPWRTFKSFKLYFVRYRGCTSSVGGPDARQASTVWRGRRNIFFTGEASESGTSQFFRPDGRKRSLLHQHEGDTGEGIEAMHLPFQLQGEVLRGLHQGPHGQRCGMVRHRGQQERGSHQWTVGRLRPRSNLLLRHRCHAKSNPAWSSKTSCCR